MNRMAKAQGLGLVLAAAFGISSSLADDRHNDAAKARYESAKEACERLTGDEQDRCEARAKADYKRSKEATRRSDVPAAPGGPGMGQDGTGGPGTTR
jgi:predicted outer membrane lipoprotein